MPFDSFPTANILLLLLFLLFLLRRRCDRLGFRIGCLKEWTFTANANTNDAYRQPDGVKSPLIFIT
jgi:hypothetical protein